MPSPPAWHPPQPYGWQAPLPPMWQPQTLGYQPTPGQRLALAIVSIVFLVPLSAIAIGTAVPVADAGSAWLGILTGLLALLLVCAAVVGVNVVFNADLRKAMRRG
jgi:hypothetical protein